MSIDQSLPSTLSSNVKKELGCFLRKGLEDKVLIWGCRPGIAPHACGTLGVVFVAVVKGDDGDGVLGKKFQNLMCELPSQRPL